MTEDEAREVLAVYLDRLRECLQEGWADWKEYLSENPKAATLRAATRASMVYDFVVAAAKKKFDDDPQVHISDKRGFTTITVGQPRIVVVRFKKFRSKKLRTSGVRTQQRIAYEEQWISLDGLDVTNLVAGYVLDRLGTEPIKLAIACPRGAEVFWSIDLDDEMASVRPVQELPLDDGPVVRSKKLKKVNKDNVEGQ